MVLSKPPSWWKEWLAHELEGAPSSGSWVNPHVASTDNYSVFHTEALKFFKNQLSSYEQSEILGYTELWFLGLEAEKLHVTPEKFSKTSFDDEHGSYMKVMGE